MTKLITTLILCNTILFSSFANTAKPNTEQKNENDTKQYTLVVFEGSDWCSFCRKFEANILKDSLVITYFQKHNIEVKRIDFPQRKKISKEQKKRNKAYAEKYAFKGLFPTVILASSQSEKYHQLASTKIKPEDFIKWVESKILLEE